MIVTVTLALGLLASADHTPVAEPIADFDRSPLVGWAELAPEEVVPFHQEGMRSQLLFGARSPGGSYAFVTVIDNTLERPAEDAADVAAYFSEEAYSHLQPEGFQKGFVTVSAGELSLRAAVFSFATRKLPYPLGSGMAPALVKAIFLPVVLHDQEGGYRNLIFVADFRGSGGDLSSFEQMSRRFVLSEGRVVLVSAEDFNVSRPNLAAPQVPVEPEQTAAAAPRQTPEERVDRLGTAVSQLTRGKASPEELRQTENYAREDGTTPLARSILELQRRERIRFEVLVWQRLLKAGTDELVARLASLLLAESISLDDAEAVRALTQGANAADLSIADLGCGDLAPLVDAVLRRGEGPLVREPSMRRFFALDPAGRCQELRVLLASEGWVAPDLAQVARETRDGRWELRQGITDQPRWIWHGGRLSQTVAAGGSAKRILKLAPVTNLLSIVESGEKRH